MRMLDMRREALDRLMRRRLVGMGLVSVRREPLGRQMDMWRPLGLGHRDSTSSSSIVRVWIWRRCLGMSMWMGLAWAWRLWIVGNAMGIIDMWMGGTQRLLMLMGMRLMLGRIIFIIKQRQVAQGVQQQSTLDIHQGGLVVLLELAQ